MFSAYLSLLQFATYNQSIVRVRVYREIFRITSLWHSFARLAHPTHIQVNTDDVLLPPGFRTSNAAGLCIRAITSACTDSACPVLRCTSKGCFQHRFRYGPDIGNFSGVTNPLLSDPLLSSEFNAHGSAGPMGLWLHPDSAKAVGGIVGGDKAELAAAALRAHTMAACGYAGAQHAQHVFLNFVSFPSSMRVSVFRRERALHGCNTLQRVTSSEG
jgi:hypothetical protein